MKKSHINVLLICDNVSITKQQLKDHLIIHSGDKSVSAIFAPGLSLDKNFDGSYESSHGRKPIFM